MICLFHNIGCNMWLLTKYFIGLLSAVQVFYFSDALEVDAHRDACIAKILSCDYYRQPFSPYKYRDIGMFTKIEDLNKACREQAAYNRCLVRAEKSCEQSIFSPMVEEMIKRRRFSTEICRPASPWQQLYLKEASCLNAYSRKAFLHCFVKFMGFDEVNIDNTLERGCGSGKAIVDCSASRIQEKCGYYAGNILRKFLKFHSLSAYKCLELNPENAKDNSFSSSPGYDFTEAIFNVLEATVPSTDFDNKGSEYYVNANIEESKVDKLEKQASPYDTISKNLFTASDFNQPPTKESLTTVEYSLFDSLDSDAELQNVRESDQFDFPALPKYDYIHKNRTTFALYEDMEMGHMKYMGCGEADFFWVILSPLGSKYCILTDLKSEYSEAIFKCTVKVDAPCSPKIDDEDKNKKADVYHRRYVATILTPRNNQRSEDMVVMNVLYLKLYPFPSKYVLEKKVNVWTTEASTVDIKKPESVSRTGPLEEDNNIEILYQRRNGSGEKWHSPTHSDEDEDVEENEYWDYYPLEEEDDIVPEVLKNGLIYIEDDQGDLIYLHDRRSPIHSRTPYQPHSLFRPRTGETPAPNESQHLDEAKIKKLVQRSIHEDRASGLLDELFVSKVKSHQLGYCSAKAPFDANSEIVPEFEIKPGGHIPSQNTKTFDSLKGVNQFLQRIPSSKKLNDPANLKPLSFLEGYVVNPSTKIKVPELTESSRTEKFEDELNTNRCGYPPEKDEFTTDCFIYSSEENEFVTHPSSGRFSEEDEFVTHPSKSRFSEQDKFVTDPSTGSISEENEFVTDPSRGRFSEEDDFVTDRSRGRFSEEDEFVTYPSRSRFSEDEFVTYPSRSSFSEEVEFVSDHSKYSPEEDEFATGHFRYPPKEESHDNVKDMADDSRYLEPDYSSSITSSPNFVDSETDYTERFTEHYFDEFTHSPYKYLFENTDAEVKPKDLKMENVWEKYLANIIKKISKALLKTEMFSEQELLDDAFITLLERPESILNL